MVVWSHVETLTPPMTPQFPHTLPIVLPHFDTPHLSLSPISSHTQLITSAPPTPLLPPCFGQFLFKQNKNWPSRWNDERQPFTLLTIPHSGVGLLLRECFVPLKAYLEKISYSLLLFRCLRVISEAALCKWLHSLFMN